MDGLSVAGGCSQGPRHVALAAQRPNQLHAQTQGNDSHRDPSGKALQERQECWTHSPPISNPGYLVKLSTRQGKTS